MKFWPIERDATIDTPYALPEVAKPVLATFSALYNRETYRPPWIGYLASEDEQFVGTCAFKSAPVDGRVEIAYFTFPEHEGRGVASRMVGQLLALASAEDANLVIAAQTLPEQGPSTSILKKHGFVFHHSLQHPEDGLVWEWRRRARTSDRPGHS